MQNLFMVFKMCPIYNTGCTVYLISSILVFYVIHIEVFSKPNKKMNVLLYFSGPRALLSYKYILEFENPELLKACLLCLQFSVLIPKLLSSIRNRNLKKFSIVINLVPQRYVLKAIHKFSKFIYLKQLNFLLYCI
jgi:hypothetical protein